MKEVSDIERRLRATAVDPGVREDHYLALRARLRDRFRGRRNHRLLTATCLAFFTLVIFQGPALESHSPFFDHYEIVGGDMAVFKKHDSAEDAFYVSHSEGGKKVIFTPETALEAKRYLELEIEYFMAGMMDLKKITAYTFAGHTEYLLFYEVDVEGETITHMEVIDANTTSEYYAFLADGGLIRLSNAKVGGELMELPSATRILDGYSVTFQRWLENDPIHGEIVVWSSEAIN